MRFNSFFSGLCLSGLFWAAPALEADAGRQADWRPVPQAFGAMPRAMGQFRPQRVAAPRPALPGYAASPMTTAGSWPGAVHYPAMPVPAPVSAYQLPFPAWGQPAYRPAAYAMPNPGYGLPPQPGQLAHWGPRPAARPQPYLQPGYAARPPIAPSAVPRRVSWNQPGLARFRPVADSRSWAQRASGPTVVAPVYRQVTRYPGRSAVPPAGWVAPSPRPGAWQGRTVFRPLPAGQQAPQHVVQAWADPRFRPMPVQYQDRRMAQDWRPVDNASLPGWLSTESSAPAWRACDLCTGS